MKPWVAGCSGIVLSLVVVSNGFAKYKLADGKRDFYFGHISFTDADKGGADCLVFREGEERGEVAVLNLPLGPGDLIQSSDARRCEIQFDNGTIVRLDLGARLKIETILAQSLSTSRKLSNLLLDRGQLYVMYKRWESPELFQVITPGAAVKLDHNAVAAIRLTDAGTTEVQMETGKAHLLYGRDKFHLHEKKIGPKQRWVVSSDTQLAPAEYETVSAFKAWNESLNANFATLHQGSTLPKPIQTLPKAVFEFAQRYGNTHGEWLWHDLYGYVWRPFLNDQRYPGDREPSTDIFRTSGAPGQGQWAPYAYGSWTSYRGDLFWIPGETWGWVPYHLGIWMWDQDKGWLWLPGSTFAPAWVVWDFYYGGTYAWRPFSLYDWMAYSGGDSWESGGGEYAEFGARPELVVKPPDRAKRREPKPPVPKEITNAVKATRAALRRGDANALAALQSLHPSSPRVKKEDLLSAGWREKTVPLDRMAKDLEAARPVEERPSRRSAGDVWKDVVRPTERSATATPVKVAVTKSADPMVTSSRTPDRETSGFTDKVAAARDSGKASRETPGRAADTRAPTAENASRFRDWNPDVRAATRMGVDITYSSRTNEVACPQLRISSHDVPSGGWRSLGSAQGGSSSGSTASAADTSAGSGNSTAPAAGSSGSRDTEGAEHKKD